MRVFVKAKVRAKEEKVEAPLKDLWDSKKEMGNKRVELTVYVKEAPIEGRANEAIRKTLAKYFKVSISQIKLISGASSRQKVFEIG